MPRTPPDAGHRRALAPAPRDNLAACELGDALLHHVLLCPPRGAGRFAGGFGRLLGGYPDRHFNIRGGCEIDEPTWCSLCLGHGNVSPAGYRWGGFYPSVMRAARARRLDMVPAPRLCGFFRDGWRIEWTYARVRMTQRILADVLAGKIARGFYTADQALRVARTLLFDTPRKLFLPDEAGGGLSHRALPGGVEYEYEYDYEYEYEYDWGRAYTSQPLR